MLILMNLQLQKKIKTFWCSSSLMNCRSFCRSRIKSCLSSIHCWLRKVTNTNIKYHIKTYCLLCHMPDNHFKHASVSAYQWELCQKFPAIFTIEKTAPTPEKLYNVWLKFENQRFSSPNDFTHGTNGHVQRFSSVES